MCKLSAFENVPFPPSLPYTYLLTLLERHITGHMEHPNVQQQHKHPQKSQRTLIGRFFLNVTLTLVTVALNSSGATLACNADGNSVSKRFESPNLQ